MKARTHWHVLRRYRVQHPSLSSPLALTPPRALSSYIQLLANVHIGPWQTQILDNWSFSTLLACQFASITSGCGPVVYAQPKLRASAVFYHLTHRSSPPLSVDLWGFEKSLVLSEQVVGCHLVCSASQSCKDILFLRSSGF